jgi:hypothetical protein
MQHIDVGGTPKTIQVFWLWLDVGEDIWTHPCSLPVWRGIVRLVVFRRPHLQL